MSLSIFAKRVLRVQSMRVPMVEELPAAAFGELCHTVLHLTYRQLREYGWPEHEMGGGSVIQTIIKVAEDVFSQYAADRATGYFLTWEIMKDSIIQLVTSVIEADQQAYREHGFQPMAFEVNAEGHLAILGSSFSSMKIRGRLDRIDVRKDPPGLRIVDYKLQTGSRMKSGGHDLLLSGIRGFHLQPPIYTLMSDFHDTQLNREFGEHGLRSEGVDFIYLAPRWDPKIVRAEFEASSWQSTSGEKLKHTVRTLLQGIQSGRYFILPGDYCRHCDVSTACRRFHGPTWWRSRVAFQAQKLRRLRTQVKQGD